MPIDPDYAPGEAAPETGVYALLTMMGSPSGTHKQIEAGAPLPPGPRGWTWRLVRQGLMAADVD